MKKKKQKNWGKRLSLIGREKLFAPPLGTRPGNALYLGAAASLLSAAPQLL